MKCGNLFLKIRIQTTSLTLFIYIFLNTFEDSFPIQNKSIGRIKNDWITQGIKISFKHIYIYSRSSNDPHMRAYCIKYCKILSIVIKEAKRQHHYRLIAKLGNQTKNLEYYKT
jgi:hypothetical protein